MIEKKLFGYDCRCVDKEFATLNEIIRSLRKRIDNLCRENERLQFEKVDLQAQIEVQREIIRVKNGNAYKEDIPVLLSGQGGE